MNKVEQRARELLEAECGKPLPLDVPVCAALSAVVAALSQQPAAVDGAYPTPRNRAEAVALARLALAHLGVIDAHIDAAIARCETDLAAQHQEPTT